MSGAAAGAAAAAAAHQQLCAMEEQEMTNYPADIENWEFKIIRSAFGQFHDREKREEILAQEAEAQWELLEVFDHTRIRLRRPITAKQFDGKLDFDPYRTSVDSSIVITKKLVAIAAVIVVLISGAIAMAAVLDGM